MVPFPGCKQADTGFLKTSSLGHRLSLEYRALLQMNIKHKLPTSCGQQLPGPDSRLYTSQAQTSGKSPVHITPLMNCHSSQGVGSTGDREDCPLRKNSTHYRIVCAILRADRSAVLFLVLSTLLSSGQMSRNLNKVTVQTGLTLHFLDYG